MKVLKFLFIASLIFVSSCSSTSVSNDLGSDAKSLNDENISNLSQETSLRQGEIELNTSDIAIEINQRATIQARKVVDVAGEEIVWSTENPEIITLGPKERSCSIVGKNIGFTRLVATYCGNAVYCNVEVNSESGEILLDSFEGKEIIAGENDEISLASSFYVKGIKQDDVEIVCSIDSSDATISGNVFSATKFGTYNVTLSAQLDGKIMHKYDRNITVNIVESCDKLTEECFSFIGRYITNSSGVFFDNCNSGIELGFNGTSFSVKVKNPTSITGRIKAIIDGGNDGTYFVLNGMEEKTISVDSLSDGYHVLKLINVFEDGFTFKADLTTFKATKYFKIDKSKDYSVLVLGDSISSGCDTLKQDYQYSWETTDSSLSYAYVLGEYLNADLEVLASQGIGVRYGWRNEYLDTNEYMTFLYERASVGRIAAKYENKSHDIVIINLGTNDHYQLDTHYKNDNGFAYHYYDLLQKVIADNPNAYIFCVYGMMEYVSTIAEPIKEAILKAQNELNFENIYYYFDFSFSKVGHPDKEEHERNAKILYDFIQSKMK